MIDSFPPAQSASRKGGEVLSARRSRSLCCHLLGVGILWGCSQLAGCGSTPDSGLSAIPRDGHPELQANASSEPSGHPAVAVARSMIGAPYRYGGMTPQGFDCSGLVYYAYREVGIAAPRTTRGQLRSSRPVRFSDVRPGDLLFFRLSGRKVSHVGIYAGDGRFIHAPSTGKRVSYAEAGSPYWRSRLIRAGRL